MEVDGEDVVAFLIEGRILNHWDGFEHWTDPSDEGAGLFFKQMDLRDSVAVNVVGDGDTQRVR